MSLAVNSKTIFPPNQDLVIANPSPMTREMAEDILIVWNALAKAAKLQEPETPEDSIKKANEFSTWFDGNLDKLSQLTFLDLAKTGIKHLPESVCRLTELKGLKLQENRLTGLPELIGALTQLNFLNLDHNPLESLPESMAKLKLRAIGLEGVPPAAIPDSVKSTPKLEGMIFNPRAWGMPEQIGKISDKKLVVLMAKDATRTKVTQIPLSPATKLVLTSYYNDKANEVAKSGAGEV